MQTIKENLILGAILVTGLALPFIGNALASMQIGEFPLYLGLKGVGRTVISYLWFIFVMEAYGFVAVVLSIICYKWCTRLKQCRYIPIYVVYLLIICFHYAVTHLLHADPFGWLIVLLWWGLIPIFWLISLFVFWIAFIFAFLIAGFSGITDRNCSEPEA